MAIIWNDNLKTGISIIDEQHELLFKTAAKLDKLKNTRADFYEILIELQTYISTHLTTEEEYMKYSVYPDYESHKQHHDKFSVDYKILLREIADADSILDLASEIIIFVETWLQEHYTNDDVKMAAFLNRSNLNNL